MKYAILTFGCRVNQADSLALEADLSARGGESVPPDRAELVIVNTCSVTASADQGARQTIRRVHRENPAAAIVATGCYATRCASEIGTLPGVTTVIGNEDKAPAVFYAKLHREASVLLPASEGPCGRVPAPGLMGRTAWTLRVQTGCEEACSYCIIPTTRGRSRSRTPDEIRAELERMMASGYKEVNITGVHLGSYGRDLAPASSLLDLASELTQAASGSGTLLRISSLEPMDFPRGLLALPVAPHFHLPLQHASNRILSLMKRPYTREFYAELVDHIRHRQPDAAIGSDVIVGFPSETDGDFEELVAYLGHSPLTHLHVFPYSDRPGTIASGIRNKVPGPVVKERARQVRDLSRTLAERFLASQRGRVRRALTIDDGASAVTDNYLRVAAGGGHERNEWIAVTV
ncbi:MAG: MiaB/RimO family radical SAM methylthiotransferase [Acidobacteriota bacterium]